MYASAEATSSADSPIASAAAWTTSPVRLPKIVRWASAVPPTKTWRMTSAMSAPGTTVTRIEPTRNEQQLLDRDRHGRQDTALLPESGARLVEESELGDVLLERVAEGGEADVTRRRTLGWVVDRAQASARRASST